MPRLLLLALTLISLGISGCCALWATTCNNPERLASECGICPAGMTDIHGECYACGQHSGARCDGAESAPPIVEVGGGGGIDRSTDGAVVQVAVGYGLRPIAIEGGFEIGQASEDGYEVPEGERLGGPGDLSQDYTVFQAFLHGKYPVPVMDGRARVYPLAGVRYLRYSQKDCEESQGVECVFPEVTLDLGGGVGYGIFSLEAYTGLIGDVPDLSVRARVMFPLGGGR